MIESKDDGVTTRRYSGVEHLVRSIAPRGCENSLMAMFAVCFDDSGTHPESNVAVAACYVSTCDQWRRLEDDWDLVRRIHDFKVFHMSDAVAGGGEFLNWPWEKRHDLILRLIALTRIRVRVGSVIAVLKEDYDSCVTGKLRSKMGRFHYSHAVRTCLSDIARWRKRHGIIGPMQYVFDQMSQGKGEIQTILDNLIDCKTEELGLTEGGYSFQNKRGLTPLQAVDILANQGYQHLRNRLAVSRGYSRSRDYMKELSEGPLITAFWNRETLADLAARVTKTLDQDGWDTAPSLFPSEFMEERLVQPR